MWEGKGRGLCTEALSLFLFHLVQAMRLRGSLDVCIDYVETSTRRLDLLAGDLSQGVQMGCPESQCLPQNSITFAENNSYVQFSVERQNTLFFKISLGFQTR